MPRVDAPTAFRQQLLGTIPRLRRYARSLVFDTSAADDLVQTTLERALAHWHQFDQRRDILVWTLAIAHNAFMDERRRDKRASWVDADDVIDALPAVGNDLGLRMDLLAALARLPVEQRQPLLLVTLEQLSYAECAEVLRIPVGTVMSRISRARTALRDLLDGRAPANARGLRRVV
ncbi:MAG: sigma-70 family RNA polymerase sigma factor [Piscinibacter sp.]|nr:sigma-70 family RNA polymerase sigma factor [Piscinibacter sp.]MBP6028716.1 sigma-70 family RNA polymerase sigma factor [Piscinibacter sp.]